MRTDPPDTPRTESDTMRTEPPRSPYPRSAATPHADPPAGPHGPTDLGDLRHHGDAEVGPGMVDLVVNVRPDGPPRWLLDHLRAAVERVTGYPDQTEALAAVAARHRCGPERVLLTSGAAEAFVLLARALRPAHAVVVHPQFTEPEAALRAAGHKVTRIVLDPAEGFRLDPRRVPDRADLVVVGNPTNPTSVLHPFRELRRLLRPGRLLVVDEAFMDAVPGEPETMLRTPGGPGGPDGPGGPPRGVAVVRSLTKTWGLAGLRAGYLITDPALRDRLAAAQPLWPVSTPALSVIAACCAPEAVAESGRLADRYAADRAYLLDGLAGLPGVAVAGRPRASFVLLRIRAGAGLSVRRMLRTRGFAVRRGDTFPGLGPDWLRVAVRPAATTDAFLDALREVIQEVPP
jgi:histidinol-phosphate aminotransferase